MTLTRYLPLVELIHDRSRLGELAPEWDELVASSSTPTVFLSWSWVSAWFDTLGSDHRIMVATAREPTTGRLVGLAPLAVEMRRAGPLPSHRALVMVGSRPAAADHLDLVARTGHEHVISVLWSAVNAVGDWDVVDLDGLRPGANVVDAVLSDGRGGGVSVRLSPCPFLVLPATWEEYESGLGRNLRQNLRRYRRRMESELAGTVVERQVAGADEAETTLLQLAELHRRARRKGLRAVAFADEGMVEFHRRVVRSLADEGLLRMHRLDVADRPVAIIYCIRDGAIVSFYQTGYDLDLARYGPGRHIMAWAIRSAIEEGATGFDFLRGDEQYKAGWGAQARTDRRLVWGTSVRGRAVALAMRTAWRVRAAGDHWSRWRSTR
jgi:CelD/BcsL family acetyltransferase involved in cellulose biosynthesis